MLIHLNFEVLIHINTYLSGGMSYFNGNPFIFIHILSSKGF